MHLRKSSLLLTLAAAAACSTDSVLTTEPGAAASLSLSSVAADVNPVAGQFLVRFKATGIPSDFKASVEAAGGELIFAHAGAGIAAVAGLDAQGAGLIAAMPTVAAVDADAYTTLEEPSDAVIESATMDVAPTSPTNPGGAYFFVRQWNMRAIAAPAAWAAPNGAGLGKATTRVGILDTGIDYLHPDLYGRVDLTKSVSFLSAAENARVQATFPGAHPVADLNFHGTHVAATVSSNALAAAGITSKVTLVGIKVCVPGVAPSFTGTCPTSAVLAGLLYAADQGLDVVNMSLGGGFNRRDASAEGGDGPSFIASLNRVFNYVYKKGTVVVVSAGNSAIDMDHDGNRYNTYCSAQHTVCVSATGPTGGRTYLDLDNVDALASYSNFGRSVVTVAAPGGDFVTVSAACSGFTIITGLLPCRSRFYNPTTGAWSAYVVGSNGTSMAAPHVTGLAALIAGNVGHNPERIVAELVKAVDDLGQPGTDPAYGKGRINVARALGL